MQIRHTAYLLPLSPIIVHLIDTVPGNYGVLVFHSAPSFMSFLRALSLLFLVPLSLLYLHFSRFYYFTVFNISYLPHITIQILSDAQLKFYLNKCHN